MAMKSLQDLFVHFMRDILYAEKQAEKMFGKMQRKADSEDLKALFDAHGEETLAQIETLKSAFEAVGLAARGVRCEAMDGIIEESKELMEEAQDGPTRDAAMIAAAQAIRHYEITRYGTIIAWAKQLGHTEVVTLLQSVLDQDTKADKALTSLATKHLNREAKALAA